MRAAVFHELGKPLAVETVDKPQAGPGEIVLKVHYCGVCGSDLHATHPGVFVVPDGTILGHEFAGEIVEFRRAVAGRSARWRPRLPNNACEDCRKLGLMECKDDLGIMCPRNTLTGFIPTAQGAYAEYVKFSCQGGAAPALGGQEPRRRRGRTAGGRPARGQSGQGGDGRTRADHGRRADRARRGGVLEARRRARRDRQRICARAPRGGRGAGRDRR